MEKYGIHNVAQRIKLYFGSDCGLHYSPNPNGGLNACISIKAVHCDEIKNHTSEGGAFMMKILIAEDEFLCRENLKRIEWASIGAELVGIAEDGDSAYELAKKFRPDLIISDIMMPNRNGLELAESLTNILPDTKFIILTAYTNFEYAKESISLGIYEYILKPFEDETLLRAAEGALKKLEQEKQLETQLENISHQLESSRYFLKSYFFHAISNNLTGSSDLSLFFGNLNFNDKYIAMAVSMENASSNMFSANYSIFSNILKILDKSPFTVIPFFDISQMTFLFAMGSIDV